MKSIFILGAIALSMTLSGVACAADASAPAPAAVDPVAAVLTPILTPIGDGLNVIVQPVVVAPVNAVTAVIAPPAPPAPTAPAPAHHRHHRRHHPA